MRNFASLRASDRRALSPLEAMFGPPAIAREATFVTSFRMTTENMSLVMYALLVTGGSMLGSVDAGQRRRSRRANAQARAFVGIRLPVGRKSEFEQITGLVLNLSDDTSAHF